MLYKYRKYLFTIFSIVIGLILTISLLALVESFFVLNAKYHWLQGLPPNSFGNGEPKYLPPEIDVSYAKDLKPYEGIKDMSEPDDYSEAYLFKDCAEPKLDLSPYWTAARNCKSRIILKKLRSRRVVYDVYYNFDEYGLRIIPSADKSKDPFLLFLGCSFTFGEGVDGAVTFSNKLTEKLGPINAFNLAMNGYGPHFTDQLLRKNREDDIRLQAIHGSKGIAIYTFIDDQVRRVINTLDWATNTGGSEYSPYFHLENGKLVMDNDFINSRPIRTKLFRFLAKSKTIQFFRIDWPIIGEEELRTFVAIIADIKENVEKKYNVEKFIFATYPNEQRYAKALKPLLEEAGITVFDFSNINAWGLFKDRLSLYGNGHPSPEAHRFYSDLLENEIKKRGLLSYLESND